MKAQNIAELEDSTLMALVADGRQSALEVLYDRYANLVYSFAMRMLGDPEAARQLLQEAFVSVWQRAPLFQPEQGSFAKWLLALVHALGIEEARRRRARPQRSEGLEAGKDDEEESISMAADSRSGTEIDAWAALRRRRSRDALQALSKEQRRTIALAYFHGYTQDEIARLTGEPLGTVKSRLRHSLQKLTEVLYPQGAEAPVS